MPIRSFLLAILIFSLSASAIGQVQTIGSEDHYIGRGEGASLELARMRAYSNLVEKIQVLVTSSLQTTATETNTAVEHSAAQSTLTFSSIMLRDVQEEIEKKEGRYSVVKFVSKAVVQSIFDQRRRQILDYLRAAEAEGDGTAQVDIDRMLGNYYKAWLMSGLYPDTLSYSFRFGGWGAVETGIPRAMQLVCDQIALAPSHKVEDEYTTWKYSVMWAGWPVKNLRFTFNDGLGESEEVVRNGSTQATFLFADKRERHVLLDIQYRELNQSDALLAVVDSARAAFAPKLSISVVLPGEKTAVVKSAAVIRPPAALPAAIQSLMEHRTDFTFFSSEIKRLSKYGDIVAGKKESFETLDGLYVIVVDAAGLNAVLRYEKGNYTNLTTGELIRLPAYAGKKILWIKVQ